LGVFKPFFRGGLEKGGKELLKGAKLGVPVGGGVGPPTWGGGGVLPKGRGAGGDTPVGGEPPNISKG